MKNRKYHGKRKQNPMQQGGSSRLKLEDCCRAPPRFLYAILHNPFSYNPTIHACPASSPAAERRTHPFLAISDAIIYCTRIRACHGTLFHSCSTSDNDKDDDRLSDSDSDSHSKAGDQSGCKLFTFARGVPSPPLSRRVRIFYGTRCASARLLSGEIVINNYNPGNARRYDRHNRCCNNCGCLSPNYCG